MKLLCMCSPRALLSESTNRWMGPIENVLGNGEDWSINYGTGDPNMPPFLYITVPISLVRTAARDAASNLVVWADQSALQGKYMRIGRKSPEELSSIRDSIFAAEPNAELIFYPKVTHVGESHVTISMAPELLKAFGSEEGIIRALRSTRIGGNPLFDRAGNGLSTEVNINREDPYLVLRAGFFRDEVDTSGPLVLAIDVDCTLYYQAREALGLPRVFRFPNGKAWNQHLTVGYIPKKNLIHRSYVDRFGSSPRERQREATGSPSSAF